MLVKGEEAKEMKNSESCIMREYALPDKSMGFATAMIDGRFPEKGKVINKECDEIYFVLSGSGRVHNEKGDFAVKQKDLFFLDKGAWYWVEGEKLRLAVVTTPPWFFEQHEQLE